MIRTYCDCCGEQIEKNNDIARLEGVIVRAPLLRNRVYGTLKLENIRATAQANAPRYSSLGEELPEHVCLNCVIDSVKAMDKRPQPAPRKALEDATYIELQQQLMKTTPPLMPMPIPSFAVGNQPTCLPPSSIED